MKDVMPASAQIMVQRLASPAQTVKSVEIWRLLVCFWSLSL